MKKTYKERFAEIEAKHPFRPYVDIIYEVLLKDIITGVYPPHSKLVEYRMASELGVSRTPVRQAFEKLEEQGFIYTKVASGAFVAPFDQNLLDDLLQTRYTLERLACAQSSERITQEELGRMFQLCVEMDIAYCNYGDGRHAEAEDNFHLHLVNCSHNDFLIKAYNSILLQIRRYRSYITQNWRLMEAGKNPTKVLSNKHSGVDFDALSNHEFRTEIGYEHYLIYLAIYNRRPESAMAALTYEMMLNNPSLKYY